MAFPFAEPHFIRIAPMVLVHAPENVPEDVPVGTLLIPQHPGSAFGEGSHPTTRLCVRAVDYWCRVYTPRSFLDVGTGTGILARLARAHGVPRVAATEIDPTAIGEAERNARLDQSSTTVTIADAAPDSWGSCFDLVAANILEKTLCDLSCNLASALAPGGTLLLSGFTPLQAPNLKSVFTGIGLTFEQEARLDEWALLRFRLGV
ncbi:MAG: 50S ribosomal protein L11 methyltransferase [Chitinispirillaceae bacterium]|nr:50S ribosomal protein L11 methyltransferase [Chitinispirillaceae bacterium]